MEIRPHLELGRAPVPRTPTGHGTALAQERTHCGSEVTQPVWWVDVL